MHYEVGKLCIVFKCCLNVNIQSRKGAKKKEKLIDHIYLSVCMYVLLYTYSTLHFEQLKYLSFHVPHEPLTIVV